MSATRLNPTVRGYNDGQAYIRYFRPQKAAKEYDESEEGIMMLAAAAGAIHRLPKTILICRKRLEGYMKHLYRVPDSGKYVKKEFVRIGEGSIMYSIGHHRFLEMARAAGAVYKLGDSEGSTILISLEIFDQYMEQFRKKPVPMKHPLFGSREGVE